MEPLPDRGHSRQDGGKAIRLAQALSQPAADQLDLLGADRMGHRIGLPLDRIPEADEPVARCDGTVQRDHLIVGAVDHQDRAITIGLGAVALEMVCDRQIGRQRKDAGQSLLEAQPGLQSDRAALGEPGEDDPIGTNAIQQRVGNHRGQCLARLAHAGFVLAAAAQLDDVVPGAHRHPAVQRHRPNRGMRKHETDRRGAREP